MTADDLSQELANLAFLFDATAASPRASDMETVLGKARRLLAALRAVLEPHKPGRVTILGALCKHHENHRHFSITRTEADDVRACPDCAATVYTSCAGCGPRVSVDACPVRETVTRELTGKEDADGN